MAILAMRSTDILPVAGASSRGGTPLQRTGRMPVPPENPRDDPTAVGTRQMADAIITAMK